MDGLGCGCPPRGPGLGLPAGSGWGHCSHFPRARTPGWPRTVRSVWPQEPRASIPQGTIQGRWAPRVKPCQRVGAEAGLRRGATAVGSADADLAEPGADGGAVTAAGPGRPLQGPPLRGLRGVGVKLIIDAADDADRPGPRGQGPQGAVTVEASQAGGPPSSGKPPQGQLLHHREHQLVLAVELHWPLQGHCGGEQAPLRTATASSQAGAGGPRKHRGPSHLPTHAHGRGPCHSISAPSPRLFWGSAGFQQLRRWGSRAGQWPPASTHCSLFRDQQLRPSAAVLSLVTPDSGLAGLRGTLVGVWTRTASRGAGSHRGAHGLPGGCSLWWRGLPAPSGGAALSSVGATWTS